VWGPLGILVATGTIFFVIADVFPDSSILRYIFWGLLIPMIFSMYAILVRSGWIWWNRRRHDLLLQAAREAADKASAAEGQTAVEVTAKHPYEEPLQQEVKKLTHLLRHADSFADLREALAAKGLLTSEVILAGLIEGEDESRYGVILTANQKCIRFETASNGSLARWETIDEPDTLTSEFQAVSVGISMMKNPYGG
jgi:hypothetical protein